MKLKLRIIITIFIVFAGISNCIAQKRNNFEYKTDKNVKRIALVIGNANYESAGVLKNTVNDANEITSELKILGFEVVLGLNLTLRELRTTINQFNEKLKLANPAIGLFYFGGHGIQWKGANYLIPVDAIIQKEQDIELETIALLRLLEEIEQANPNLNFIIVDACRENNFHRYTESTENKGLASVMPTLSNYVIFGARPGYVSNDGGNDYGYYATAFVNIIDMPNLTFVDFLKNIRKSVYVVTDKNQIPWDNGSINFEFYFNKTE